MRSNKDTWLRGITAVAWVAVLVCAAYTLAYLTRGKDWRDYTPIERIAVLTPKHVSSDIALDGGSMRYVVSDTGIMDGFVVSFPPYITVGAPARMTPRLTRVATETMQIEITPGSELQQAILACLDRAIRSGDVDARSLPQLIQLRSRLTKEDFSQGVSMVAH